MITHRYAKANNKYLQDYDPEKPTSFIIYKDANNLYGHAMSQPLPIGDFKWMPEREIASFDVTTVTDDADTGYILEVDLEYPPELHDLHSDYPLAPEKIEISPEMLAPYQLNLKDELEYTPAKVAKLVPNLWNKRKYVIHYRNLKQYLSLGTKLTKIHRVLQFKQEAWLKPYIELNSQLRREAKTDFEKDLFKLMNNSVFGKTLEDVRKRVNIKLVTEPSIFKKHVAKVTYKRSVVFINDEEKKDYFVGVERKHTSVVLDKPIYKGFTVLELSKLDMYNFPYKVVMAKYGPEKAKLLFTDTDSLTSQIKTDDLYQDMLEDQDLLDTSNYPREYQHSMMGFESQRHQLFTVKRTKKSSCPFDDKRLILEDGCMTRAHGHWRNAIARPSQAPTEAEPSEEGRLESMTALSLSKSNTDVQEPSTVDSSDAQESSIVYSTDLNGYSFP